MNHRPTQREKHHTIPFETQFVEFPDGRSTRTLDFGQNCLDLNIDQLAASSIGDSKLESGLVSIRCYDCIPTVDNSRRRSREPGENHACGKRDTDDVQQRFDGDQKVRWNPDRDDVSVADRSKRVDAEKERPVESMSGETARN